MDYPKKRVGIFCYDALAKHKGRTWNGWGYEATVMNPPAADSRIVVSARDRLVMKSRKELLQKAVSHNAKI